MRLIDADALLDSITSQKLLSREAAARRIIEIVKRATTYVFPEEVEHGEWISVEDRLPDNETDVLVCVKRKRYNDPDKYIRFVVKAFYTDGKHDMEHTAYCWDDCLNMEYDEEDDEVTHWRPLPELPKMDGGKDESSD